MPTPAFEETDKTPCPKYMVLFLLAYLLIPILSVEGLIGWSIGMFGACKTIRTYRRNEENKDKKAVRLLIICLMVAVAYNLLVNYATVILIKKLV